MEVPQYFRGRKAPEAQPLHVSRQFHRPKFRLEGLPLSIRRLNVCMRLVAIQPQCRSNEGWYLSRVTFAFRAKI